VLVRVTTFKMYQIKLNSNTSKHLLSYGYVPNEEHVLIIDGPGELMDLAICIQEISEGSNSTFLFKDVTISGSELDLTEFIPSDEFCQKLKRSDELKKR